jgi:DNA invertase Pin-like site-specific DNA recombinase
MRAALYARISTPDQRQHAENQVAALRQFIQAHEWEAAGEYIDHASGDRHDRPALTRMMQDAIERKFDVVAVFALDRLTREGVEETFSYIARLKRAGVELVSATEEHFRTQGPAGELLLAVAAWIAKQERRRLQERIKAGLDRARAAGVRLGRPPCYADTQQIATLRTAGRSWRQIAKITGVPKATAARVYARFVATPQRRTYLPRKPRT